MSKLLIENNKDGTFTVTETPEPIDRKVVTEQLLNSMSGWGSRYKDKDEEA